MGEILTLGGLSVWPPSHHWVEQHIHPEILEVSVCLTFV